MPYVLKNKEGHLLTYGETSFPYNAEKGETLAFVEQSMAEYSRRLVLSHKGSACFTVEAHQGDPAVVIDVSTTLDLPSVDLEVNGQLQTIPLVGGKGKLELSTAKPGVFIIRPADRKTFCSAGSSVIVLEVLTR